MSEQNQERGLGIATLPFNIRALFNAFSKGELAAKKSKKAIELLLLLLTGIWGMIPFPPFFQKRLLILSPDSRNDLIDYDPNDIYVIGGIVEKTNKER